MNFENEMHFCLSKSFVDWLMGYSLISDTICVENNIKVFDENICKVDNKDGTEITELKEMLHETFLCYSENIEMISLVYVLFLCG